MESIWIRGSVSGPWVLANEGGRTGAGECERRQVSANEGGGATVAAAATAGPPFLFIYLVFHLVRWQPFHSIPPNNNCNNNNNFYN
jgi:hypothetical protein